MSFGLSMDRVIKNLADEETRDWFDARLKYACTHDPFDFYPAIYRNCHGKMDGWDLGVLMSDDYKNKTIMIFGANDADNYDKHSYEILRRSALKSNIYGFLNNNPKQKELFGLPVLSIFDLDEKLKDSLFIISSPKAGKAMYHELTRFGISQKNIFFPSYGRLTAGMGNQYFDVFQPVDKEVFVDAGCYNAETSISFSDWCKGDYEMIYAFEASNNMAKVCREKFQQAGITSFELVEKACYDNAGKVNFICDSTSELFGGARVDDDARGIEVPTESIDNVLQGKRVTFIKMDIEGSELAALKGATDSIRQWRPRLAISLYHKFEDIIEVPSYIVSIVPDYHLYIRHYSSDIWETVLYAI